MHLNRRILTFGGIAAGIAGILGFRRFARPEYKAGSLLRFTSGPVKKVGSADLLAPIQYFKRREGGRTYCDIICMKCGPAGAVVRRPITGWTSMAAIDEDPVYTSGGSLMMDVCLNCYAAWPMGGCDLEVKNE